MIKRFKSLFTITEYTGSSPEFSEAYNKAKLHLTGGNIDVAIARHNVTIIVALIET